jgi:transposase
MALQRDQLPDDVETLKRLLIGREELIEKLMAEISRLRRWRFGRSSERTDTELAQLQLLLEGLQAALSSKNDARESEEHVPAEDSKEQDTNPGKERGKRPAKKRGEFPAHFPRETIVHAPASCSCPDCGAKMRTLGEDVSEQLDYVPGYYKVLNWTTCRVTTRCCGTCGRSFPAATARG